MKYIITFAYVITCLLPAKGMETSWTEPKMDPLRAAAEMNANALAAIEIYQTQINCYFAAHPELPREHAYFRIRQSLNAQYKELPPSIPHPDALIPSLLDRNQAMQALALEYGEFADLLLAPETFDI